MELVYLHDFSAVYISFWWVQSYATLVYQSIFAIWSICSFVLVIFSYSKMGVTKLFANIFSTSPFKAADLFRSIPRRFCFIAGLLGSHLAHGKQCWERYCTCWNASKQKCQFSIKNLVGSFFIYHLSQVPILTTHVRSSKSIRIDSSIPVHPIDASSSTSLGSMYLWYALIGPSRGSNSNFYALSDLMQRSLPIIFPSSMQRASLSSAT